MKNKLKKIITTTAITAVSLTAIGCGNSNSKLAKNIDKSMADFVSSINKLDYVDTSAPNSNIGKIVETSNLHSDQQSRKIRTNGNQIQFLNNNISEIEIENTITRPQDRSDNFKLYVLSDVPYISLTSDDTSANLNMTVKFSTNKIEEASDEINTKINNLILKRSILMIYVNEIYNGNVDLSEDNKIAINAYVNVIKENTSYLNGNRGMVKNQLSLASDLVSSEQNENLVNYYIIKSGEALETRSNKFDSTIEAIDSIIDIIENNLTNSSCFYQSNLSDTYQNIISNLTSENIINEEITKDSTNQEIANTIANSLNLTKNLTITNNESPELENTTENNNQLLNNSNNILNKNNSSNLSNINTFSNNNSSIISKRNSQLDTTNNQSTIRNDNNTNQNSNNTTNRFNNTNTKNSTINRNYNLESQTNNNFNNKNISSTYNNATNNQKYTNKNCPECNNNTIANSTTNPSTYNYRNNTNNINQNSINQNNSDKNYNQSSTYQNETNTNSQTTTRNTEQNHTYRNTRNSRNRQTTSRRNSRNNTINSRNRNNQHATIGVNETKPNSAKSVVNMNEEDKTMRADRTSEKNNTEEYTSKTSLNTTENRARRMPYRTN